VAAAQVSWWYADIHASSSTEEAWRSLKRFTMKRYRPKFVGVLFKSINSAKKALFCIRQGLLSFYCNGDDIHDLLILCITNTIAWLSLHSNYLPAPVKVVWVILAPHYRRVFADQ
jgi:hypothetical protein